MKSTKKQSWICSCDNIVPWGSQCQKCGTINTKPKAHSWYKKVEKKEGEKYYYEGEYKTLPEWSRDLRCQVSVSCLKQRMNLYDWPFQKSLLTPSLQVLKRQRQENERNIELSKRMLD